MKTHSLARALVAAVVIAVSGSVHAAEATRGPVIGQLVLDGGAAAPVHGFSWSVSADSSWTKGAGASVAKPYPEALRITRSLDSNSLRALLKIATGAAFAKAVLTVNLGKGKEASKIVYELEDLFVTNVAHAAEEGLVTESISFVFKTVKWTVTDPDGNATSLKWDIQAGTAS